MSLHLQMQNMKQRNKLRFTLLLIAMLTWVGLSGLLAQSVNIGTPPIWNFPKKVYKAGTQNWDAAQDRRGVMYWANNQGLLQFDGSTWQCLPVTNNTIVRSVAIDTVGRIFVGAQSELGYFAAARNGHLVYHSLAGLLPESQRDFEDVWDISFWGNDVFFRTNKVVFQYSAGKIKIHELGGALTAMFTTRQGILVQKDFTTLMRFQGGIFQLAHTMPDVRSSLTGAIAWAGDTLLLSTLKNGIFYINGTNLGQWKTPNDALLQQSRIYSATALPGKKIALGTSLSGLLILDEHRRVFWQLTKNHGLLNNNILHTFADKSGNVWLGLDNGIDCVVLDAAFTSIIPDGELQGTGYAAAAFDGKLYLGVSNGVYVTPWQTFYSPAARDSYQKIAATEGQVWGMKNIGNQLLLGHHEGAFSLSDGQATNISTELGAWTFVQLSDEYMLGGTYNGLVLYQKTAAGWQFSQKLDGLKESCRIMVKDADGAVWVSHPYRGLYRVTWSAAQKSKVNVQFFNAKNGLPSDLNNYVFDISGKAVFATEKGVYRFDKTKSKFVADADFGRVLGNDQRIKYLRQDEWGKIWYIADNETGVLLVDDFGLKKEIKKKTFPELSSKLVGGFEFIYPIDQNNVLFGVEQGFLLYNPTAVSRDTNLQVILSRVTAQGSRDSTLFEGWFLGENDQMQLTQPDDFMPNVRADMNNIRFEFSTTDYKDPSQVQYRIQLDGLENKWSEWSPETKRDYIHLAPGKYTFRVQARLLNGRESNIVLYTFTVSPPWYASTFALTLYLLAFIGLILRFFTKQKQKFETELTELAETHQQKEAEHLREVAQSKALLSEIQTEKLEGEIQFKNQELATATMHLVQKGEILLTVQEALRNILDKQTNPAVRKEVQQLLNLLNFDKQLDEDWSQFALHFDKVHVDFLQRLRSQFPQLSINDHKLCAYLRLNLNTKEIAPLMNISVRGVEASRYRLRRKLGLPNDANLIDFLTSI